MKAGVVIEIEHYLYSSVIDYSTGKDLIDVLILDGLASVMGYIQLRRFEKWYSSSGTSMKTFASNE